MKFYQHWIGDYQKATRRLSMTEHGAYRLLLDEYYSSEEPLPANAMHLHRICIAFAPEEQAAVHNVLQQFFTLTDDGWIHTRVEEEIEKSRKISTKRSAAASSRWGENAQESRRQRVVKAKSKGTHTEEEWSALLSVFEHKCVKCGRSGEDVELTKDHIVPLSKDGSDSIDNIQPLCQRCNSSRSGDVEDYRASAMQMQCKTYAKEMQSQSQSQSQSQEEPKEKKTRSRFTPPSLEDVQDYCRERNKGVDPVRWFDYYTANGWKVGRNAMVNWKAAVHTWEKDTPPRSSSMMIPTGSKLQQREERTLQSAREFAMGDMS